MPVTIAAIAKETAAPRIPRIGNKIIFSPIIIIADIIPTILGVLLSVILSAANAYLGLFAGMTVSASIPAAVISMGILRLFKNSTILENNLVEEAQRKGVLLHGGLGKLKEKYCNRISYCAGKGLIAAILFKDPKTEESDSFFSSRVAEACMRKGLLVVHTGRESIKIGPPLTIPDDALQEGIEILDEAIAECS